jgi:hypothetical protein
MKIFYRLLPIFFIFVAYVIYKDFQIQRKDYQKNIQSFLQTACESLIETQYGHHASFSGFDESNKDNKLLRLESGFDGFNNLVFIHLKHSSTVYYQDYAPQEIICTAHIGTNGKDLSEMTSVKFNIDGPRYVPTLKRDPFRSSSIELNFAKIKELIIYNWPTPLKKPTFRFSNYFCGD